MIKPERWTAELVKEWLREAAETERSFPAVRAAGYNCCWPDIKRDQAESYGWGDDAEVICRPTSIQIERYDFVSLWCRLLDKETAAMVWALARGVPAKIIQHSFAVSKSKLYRDVALAHKEIARCLNSGISWEDVTGRKLAAVGRVGQSWDTFGTPRRGTI